MPNLISGRLGTSLHFGTLKTALLNEDSKMGTKSEYYNAMLTEN